MSNLFELRACHMIDSNDLNDRVGLSLNKMAKNWNLRLILKIETVICNSPFCQGQNNKTGKINY